VGLFRSIFTAAIIIGIAILAPYAAPLIAATLGISAAAALAVAGVAGSMIGAMLARGLDRLIWGKGGTKQEAAKTTTRISEPTRWLAAGRCRLGGNPLFGEFDSSGNFWMVIVHCDSILTDTVTYYLDDTAVVLNGSNEVTTSAFCLTSKGETFEGSGTKVPYYQIWTTTHTETDPTPPAITALTSAFPTKWTSSHKLVGTTYSVMRCKAVKDEWRSKAYRWRGPFQMGEPALSIVGEWSNMYDPRDETQTLGDRTTYKPSRNAALVWAWWRTHPYGRRKSESSVNWVKIAEQADICDQTVTGIAGTHTRYRCDVAAADDRERSDIEEEILRAMDGQIMFDDTGKAWCRAGYYYTPSVALYRNRDIMAMETMETQTGESDTQGVIVRYTDPESNYSIQPCAPWINEDHYVEGQPVEYLTIDAPTITDHNQAVRIAKTNGKRMQSLRKVGPTTGLRSLKAMSDRIIDLNYDNVFAGDYEVISPIELDASGLSCRFVGVPVDANRWSLLEGEEGVKPAGASSTGSYVVSSITTVTASFNGDKIKATYTPDETTGAAPIFEYREASSTDDSDWAAMTVDDDLGVAWSGPVLLSVDYHVRYRNISPGGRVSLWSDPPITVSTAPDSYTTIPAAAGGITLTSWESEMMLTTGPIARAATYRWRFYKSDGTTLLRTKVTNGPDVGYSSAEAEVDGIERSYIVKVAGVNSIGVGAESTTSTLTKAAPTAPASITATGGDYTATVAFGAASGAIGYALHFATTSAFDPLTEGRVVYNTGALSEILYSLEADTYYVIVAGFDAWTKRPDLLNFSIEDDFVIAIGGGSEGGEGGGFCVTIDANILTPDGLVKAGDLQVGDIVWTQHEVTLEWGAYPVTVIDFVEATVYTLPVGSPPLRATAGHKIWLGDGWIEAAGIGDLDGSATVARISVKGAKTYISNGVLSHNIKA